MDIGSIVAVVVVLLVCVFFGVISIRANRGR